MYVHEKIEFKGILMCRKISPLCYIGPVYPELERRFSQKIFYSVAFERKVNHKTLFVGVILQQYLWIL